MDRWFAAIFTSGVVWPVPMGEGMSEPELEKKLETAVGAERIAVLNRLAEANIDKAPLAALEHAEEALTLAREAGDREGEFNALRNIGSAYIYTGDYPNALDRHLESLAIARELGKDTQIAGMLNNIATIHGKTGNIAEALECNTKSLEILERIGDKGGMGRALNNIGLCHRQLENYDKALECYQRSISLKEEIGDTRGIGYCLNNIGIVHEDLGNREEALPYYRKALEIREKSGDKHDFASSLLNIGNCIAACGDTAAGIEYLKKGLRIAEGGSFKNLVKYGFGSISAALESQGKYPEALDFYRRYHELTEGLFSVEKSVAIARMRTDFDLVRKEIEIGSLKKARDVLEQAVLEHSAEAVRKSEKLEFEVAVRKREGEKVKHLNAVLRAIRKVHQLITKEKDRDRLIEKACELLTETRGFFDVWIALLGDEQNTIAMAESGLGDIFPQIRDRFIRGELPKCAHSALDNPEIILVESPLHECADCPLADSHAGKSRIAVRLEHAEITYGVLCAAIPVEFAKDREEQDLFKEIAEDIAFALYSIEQEEKRKRAEEYARTLSSVVEQSTEGMAIADLDGNLTFVNNAWADMHGYDTTGELLGLPLSIFHTNEQLEKDVIPFNKKVFEKGFHKGEVGHKHRDGSIFPTQMNTTVIKGEDGRAVAIVGSASVITARKQAEEALRASEDKLSQIIEGNSIATFVIDMGHTVTHWNRACESLTGISANEITGTRKQWSPFYTEERPVMADLIVDNATEEDIAGNYAAKCGKSALIEGAYHVEDFFPHMGEEGRWLFVTAAPLKDAEGEVNGAIETLQDVTERRQTEEDLRQRQDTINAIVETSRDWIWAIDTELVHTYSNPAVEVILGYDSDELIGLNSFELMHPDDSEVLGEPLKRSVSEKRGWTGLVIRWRHKDGSYRYLESNAVPILDTDGGLAGFRGVDRDITDRKQAEEEKALLEEQLRQSQKIEAIGRLAGGVAHDFNNLLTGITGYTQLLLESVEESPEITHDLTQIRDLAARAADLTGQLLAFSRKQPLKPVVLNINSLVENMSKILRRLIGENVDLKYATAPNLGSVRADPGQIEQIIVNLAVNARDAMPSGGALTIETANVVLDETYTKEHSGVTPGPYILLAVSDTGRGIDEETRLRIFEPFFTTKQIGEGTGLGLATAYGIVKQHGGNIWVYSEVDKGTTFKIYLPEVRENVSEAPGETKVQPSLRGLETVLIAEDEEAVLTVSQRALEGRGYTVFTATNPEEAEAIFFEQNGKIDLLLTDVVMPIRSGKELYLRLKAAKPGLKVLYMSGYTDNAIVHAGRLDPGTPFIAKPFTPGVLAKEVRSLLDTHARADGDLD